MRMGRSSVSLGIERAARREHTLLEAPVADHLGIKAAITRTGNFFEKDAVER